MCILILTWKTFKLQKKAQALQLEPLALNEHEIFLIIFVLVVNLVISDPQLGIGIFIVLCCTVFTMRSVKIFSFSDYRGGPRRQP